MRTYIKKLQSKSENTRKQIFAGTLAVCMVFVFLIWISSLGYKFNNNTSAQVEEDIKPFALFGQTLTNTYSNVTASVGNLSTKTKEDEQKMEEELKIEKQVDLIPVENQ
ncbi:MAG: hypothetical protein WC603_03675 [Candidatus Paceibacterota bacterium]|jgi:hypothetical protein